MTGPRCARQRSYVDYLHVCELPEGHVMPVCEGPPRDFRGDVIPGATLLWYSERSDRVGDDYLRRPDLLARDEARAVGALR